MRRKSFRLLAALLLVGTAIAPAAALAQSTIGYATIDTPSAGDLELDITNVTGVNDGLSPDSDPVTTSVNLLSLSIYFNGSLTATPYTFTLDSDGISEDGTAKIASFFDVFTEVTIDGTFSTTTLNQVSGSETVNSTFSDTILGDGTHGDLQDGDYVAIVTTPASSGPPPIPEPEPFLMVGTGLTALAGLRRRFLMSSIRKLSSSLAGLAVVLAIAGVSFLAPAGAQAQATLAAWTVPSSGLAGFNLVTDTAAGVPSGATASSTTASFATSCGGPAVATVNPLQAMTKVGPNYRAQFGIPSSLTTGTYFVTLSSSSPAFTSTDCSEITVTATTTTLASCVPTSSLAVVAGTNVDAYVPNGSWDYGTSGIERVPLEGTDVAQVFTTTGVVNSCAANSVTGEVICTENSTNVDLISGPTATAKTTINSGATNEAGFSGGVCYNCGVGVNAGNNTAVIAGGFSGHSGDGVQVLNLATNTFNTPVPMYNVVSEDISIDPGRNLILSPGEDGNYTLLQIAPDNTLTEYGQQVSVGEFDSAAEDCTTGIALASIEFTENIYITDLTQAVFTPGTPGTWTGAGQVLPLVGSYAAGTCGISTAPGTNHLGVVTGEFGGSSFSALKLPSTSGSGTPTLADYAYVAAMPNAPDGSGFSAGADPHTVTAYTSPNSGLSYAVFADDRSGYSEGVAPAYLAVVDLACVLAAPRSALNTVALPLPTACYRYITVP